MKIIKIKSQKLISKNRGFTLVETLVAVFILVLSITGPMSAAQNSLKSAFLARDQVVAFYLAQDAIESIKNYKDQIILSNLTATSKSDTISSVFRSSCSSSTGPCNIDTLSNPFSYSQCNGGVCSPLFFDTNTKKYTLTGGTDRILSKFTREVYIDESGIAGKDDEYKVVVHIKWQPNFFASREIVIQQNIYNWGLKQ